MAKPKNKSLQIKQLESQLEDARKSLDLMAKKYNDLSEQLRDKWKSNDKNAQSIANDIKKKIVYRPSGRPPKVDDDTTALILELRKNDCTMREIAKEVSLSVGTIHKIISENSEKMV